MTGMLENEVALITGASRGIGQAIAVALGHQGAKVIGTSTSSEGAEHISKALRDNKVTGVGKVLNVTDSGAVAALYDELEKTLGSPTILVNNAGITRDGLLLRMSEADWDVILDTDLKSVYRTAKICLRGMMKVRKGRIINVTSVVAATGNAGQSNYAAAKAGIIGFTRSLAREVGSRNITVNAVAPGYIDTDMTRALPQAARDALLAQVPLSRFGNVDDVAQAVVFLASPHAAYITGATLHINGGMYMN
jgi:3-oxoacyl-[acyl-carrier protein] reductase